MRKGLISLLFIPVFAQAQVINATQTIYIAAACTNALERFQMENSGTGEEGLATMTLYNGATYDNTAGYVKAGSYSLDCNNGGGNYAVVSSIDYGDIVMISIHGRQLTDDTNTNVWDAMNASDGFECLAQWANDRMGIRVGNGTNTEYIYSNSSLGLTSSYHHFVWVMNFTAGTVAFFLDGSAVGTGVITYTPVSTTTTATIGLNSYTFWDEAQIYNAEGDATDASALNSDPQGEICID